MACHIRSQLEGFINSYMYSLEGDQATRHTKEHVTLVAVASFIPV